MKNDIVLLYSGGQDSRLLLELALSAKHRPLCLLVDYGHLHSNELSVAKRTLNNLNIDWEIMSVVSTRQLNSRLTNGISSYSNVSTYYVPNRNMILLSLAAALAESEDIEEVWYGPNRDDVENLFPDCTPEFVRKVNEVLKEGTSSKIRVVAPLNDMSKDMIKLLCNNLGINSVEYFSGYGGI